MIPRQRLKKHSSIRERVAYAYFKLGRFFSSHPVMTIFISVCTFLLCSYPITRLWSSPDLASFDFFESTLNFSGDSPAWHRGRPYAYIQQIIVQAVVPAAADEGFPKEAQVHAVKASFAMAFEFKQRVANFPGVEDFCYRVNASQNDLAPSNGCLILSPASLWKDSLTKLVDDKNELWNSVYTTFECSSAICSRHLAFGLPMILTGKRHARPPKIFRYAITLVLKDYNPSATGLDPILQNIVNELNRTSDYFVESPYEPKFSVETPPRNVHVFYKTGRSRWIEYIPVCISYVLLFFYIYYSVSKITNVKSKWGLAFAAVFTLASSLVMTVGLCVYFDITPTLYHGELYPYLMLIVGVENTLAVTRSVVSIPINLDVRSRLSHGLSREGWHITKNFLTEQAVIAVGYLSGVPQIQEFCFLATFGLFIDFFMQLTFFIPVLTFDLQRFDAQDKEQLSIRQMSMSPVLVENYPSLSCPFQKVMPRPFASVLMKMFGPTTSHDVADQRRSHSHSVNEGSNSSVQEYRRTNSSGPTSDVSVDVNQGARDRLTLHLLPRHLKGLYFWAGSRAVQRFLKILILLWILWLAVIVNQFKALSGMNSLLGASSGTPAQGTTHQLETARLVLGKVSEWQKATAHYWPVLFEWYNISLADKYITVLPPIFVGARVDLKGYFNSEETSKFSGERPTVDYDYSAKTDIRIRISWLELQMTLLVTISISLFVVVAAFMCYVCFYSDSRAEGEVDEMFAGYSTSSQPRKLPHRRIGSRAIVESIPVVFRGHDKEIEACGLANPNVLVSACMDKLLVWDSHTGEKTHHLNEVRTQGSGVASDMPLEDAPSHSGQPALRFRGNVAAVAPQPQLPTQNTTVLLHPVTGQPASGGLTLLLRNNIPPIWSLAVQKSLAVVGYASGRLEFWDVDQGSMRGFYQPEPNQVALGVVHLVVKGSRIIAARFKGTLDFLDLRLATAANHMPSSSNQPNCFINGGLTCSLAKSVSAHQHTINVMKSVAERTLVTASADYTLKVFDLITCTCIHTLHGHNASVVYVVTDEKSQCAYSSCIQGFVCMWDLYDGCLLRTMSEALTLSGHLALALTDTYVLGLSVDTCLWVWKRSTGQLVTRMRPSGDIWESMPCLAVLNDSTIVTGYGNGLACWICSNGTWVILREVKLEDSSGPIKFLITVDGTSVICAFGNLMYRVSFPVLRVA